jgi:putative glutamine amidotransferase
MHLYKNTFYSFILLSLLLAIGCKPIGRPKIENQRQTIIAITKAHGSESYQQYKNWIQASNPNIQVIDLYGLTIDSISFLLKNIDGLIISGGPDINPNLYHEDSIAYLCETPDNYRDSIEMMSLQYSFSHHIPILGICRGHQIMNVFFGGSLYADIPTQVINNTNHRKTDGIAYHSISFSPTSVFKEWNLQDSVVVNSAHHQAVKRLGDSLVAIAFTDDGLVEAYQYANYKPFLLGVQFHPEHMQGQAISDSIRSKFIAAANKTYQHKRKNI